MSERKRECETCDYSDRNSTPMTRCRYNPTVVGQFGAQWPQVHLSDWCGRWKLAREIADADPVPF